MTTDLPYGVDGEWADGTVPARAADVARAAELGDGEVAEPSPQPVIPPREPDPLDLSRPVWICFWDPCDPVITVTAEPGGGQETHCAPDDHLGCGWYALVPVAWSAGSWVVEVTR